MFYLFYLSDVSIILLKGFEFGCDIPLVSILNLKNVCMDDKLNLSTVAFRKSEF